MLELKDIVKVYGLDSDNKVEALKGVSIDFRENELVSILGPSGCGKTTLLNIVGGLDKYTSGDLVINDKSTKDFNDRDWDTYRNQRVGFVFQNYNLIPHLSVLGNVELALTLSGIPSAERKARAVKALEVVGLSDQIKKRPNQLSGGQMQRVAIARAIVNNPDIILADEPTGALDSTTSVQVMDILKDLSKERLVIMVTHNNELAQKYSTRIIELLDGEMVKDSMPYKHEKSDISAEVSEKTDLIKEQAVKDIVENSGNKGEVIVNENNDIVKNGRKQKKTKKSAMSFFTAFMLSLKNLFSKKARTILVSFAGSIGIIGVALVLAVSNGFTNYINKMQSDALSGYPLTITTISADMDAIANMLENGGPNNQDKREEFPNSDSLYVKDENLSLAGLGKYSFISPAYIDYLKAYQESDAKKPAAKQTINDISYSYSSPMVVIGTANGEYKNINTSDTSTSALGMVSTTRFSEGLANSDFVKSQYDVIYGSYPDSYDELALVVSSTNELSRSMLDSLQIEYKINLDGTFGDIKFSDLVTTDTHVGKTYKLIYNNERYQPVLNGQDEITGFEENRDYRALYNDPNAGLTLKISGVFRVKEDAALSMYGNGLIYTPMLTEHFRANAKQSTIINMQRDALSANPNVDFYKPFQFVVQGMPFGPFKNATEVKMQVKAMLNIDLTDEQIYHYAVQQYGASDIPNAIYIYPKNFEAKEEIANYLNAWNEDPSHANNQVYFTDATAILSSTLGELVNTISYVLIAFASISLVVSSIMIGIITYVSVVERTKEIGVLRALGARKKDIRRVFNAETLIIGFTAGLIGVLVSALLTIPISAIIAGLSSGMVPKIATLTIWHGVALVSISMTLTLISGLIPAQIASTKDPVVALRTE